MENKNVGSYNFPEWKMAWDNAWDNAWNNAWDNAWNNAMPSIECGAVSRKTMQPVLASELKAKLLKVQSAPTIEVSLAKDAEGQTQRILRKVA